MSSLLSTGLSVRRFSYSLPRVIEEKICVSPLLWFLISAHGEFFFFSPFLSLRSWVKLERPRFLSFPSAGSRGFGGDVSSFFFFRLLAEHWKAFLSPPLLQPRLDHATAFLLRPRPAVYFQPAKRTHFKPCLPFCVRRVILRPLATFFCGAFAPRPGGPCWSSPVPVFFFSRPQAAWPPFHAVTYHVFPRTVTLHGSSL